MWAGNSYLSCICSLAVGVAAEDCRSANEGTRNRSLIRRGGCNEDTTLSISSLRWSPMCMYLMW